MCLPLSVTAFRSDSNSRVRTLATTAHDAFSRNVAAEDLPRCSPWPVSCCRLTYALKKEERAFNRIRDLLGGRAEITAFAVSHIEATTQGDLAYSLGT